MLPASVNLMPEAPVRRIVELAAEAERLGFSRCWVYDEGLAARDVYVTLTAIALGTDEVRVGPGITNPHTRHPASTAAAIATLDELSGGRAFLGLGAGGSLTLDPMGIDRDKPLTAVKEMIAGVRGLFAGDRVDIDGETVRFVGAKLDYARPDIEIWLAGRGPKMMQAAGELADGFNLSYVHRDTIGELLGAVRSAAADCGRAPRISYSTQLATTDSQFEHARRNMTFRLVDSPAPVKEAIAFGPDDTAAIRAALSSGGPAAAAPLVKDEWVTPFIISGSVTECGRTLRCLIAKHAIDEFQLPVQEIDDAEQSIELVAELLTTGPDRRDVDPSPHRDT